MTPGALEEVEYETQYFCLGLPSRRGQVRGYPVGRLAVRQAPADEHALLADGTVGRIGGWWIIDHVPSGEGLTIRPTFDDAMRVADDLSRFASVDLDASNIEALIPQIGPELVAWVRAIVDMPVAVPYREWLAQQQQGGAA